MAEQHVISYLQDYKRANPEATSVELTPEQEAQLQAWCEEHAESKLAPVLPGGPEWVRDIMPNREIYGMKF
jgi:hypothetical protein